MANAMRDQRTMLRGGSGPRAARANRRSGRGKFVNFYEDLGISTTPEKAQAIREEEARFQSVASEQRGKIADAQGKLGAAQGQLKEFKGETPDVKSAVDDAYSKVQKSWVPVKVAEPRLYQGTGNLDSGYKDAIRRKTGADERGVISTYRLPQEQVDALNESSSISSQWEDGSLVVYDRVRIPGDSSPEDIYYPGTMNNAIKDLTSNVETKLRDALTDEVGSALTTRSENISEQEGMLGEYQGQISGAQAELSAAEQRREDQWAAIRGDQEQRLENMRKIFENLEVS